MTDIIRTMIALKNEIKEKQDKLKVLQEELVNDENFKEADADWYRVMKKQKMFPKIREGVDTNELVDKFPDLTEVKINAKELSKDPDWQQYCEVKKSEYIEVRKIKEEEF